MYDWLRKMRNGKTGKPMFVFDFQDDAEYVGGCIAGGRNYFHINSAGDIEPAYSSIFRIPTSAHTR